MTTDLRAVVNLLKTAPSPVQLKDIIEGTKEQVEWGKNPYTKFYRLLEHDRNIVSSKEKGCYTYKLPEGKVVSTSDEDEKPFIPAALKEQTRQQIAASITSPVVPTSAPLMPTSARPASGSNTTMAVTWAPERPGVVVEPPEPITLRYGQEMNCMVVRIEEYGVFCDCYDYNLSGLIHKSKVKKGRMFFGVDDLRKHFREGDTIVARVDSFSNGKLALQTYMTHLPTYQTEPTVMEEKLAPAKGVFSSTNLKIQGTQEPVRATQPAPAPITPTVPVVAPVPPSAPATTPVSTSYAYSADATEMEALYEMVRGKVGVISMTAKDSLRDLVRRMGIMKVTMAFMQSGTFEADVSLAFAKHLESIASGRL